MRIVRTLKITAVTAMATAGVTVGTAAGTVGAVRPDTPLSVKCTGLSGKGGPGSAIRLSGCSGSGAGITGSTGTELFNTPAGGTSQVTWATGAQIFDENLAFDYNAPHMCAPEAGYKFASAVQVTGTVGGGTGSASRLNGAKVNQHFCQYVTGNGSKYLTIGYGTQRE